MRSGVKGIYYIGSSGGQLDKSSGTVIVILSETGLFHSMESGTFFIAVCVV
ncbi:hypothetical protein UFO1_3413 [Pelosinus sp. UFO1]|nr:hypothetical protein UFO1_3413 [Pelosinus sp. UFO1]